MNVAGTVLKCPNLMLTYPIINRILQTCVKNSPRTYSVTSLDLIDDFTSRLVQKQSRKWRNDGVYNWNNGNNTPSPSLKAIYNTSRSNISSFDFATDIVDSINDLSQLSTSQLDRIILSAMAEKKHKQIDVLLAKCVTEKRVLSDSVIKLLLDTYSSMGRIDIVTTVIERCEHINSFFYHKNGGLNHYVAIAQCFKGNSEKGLTILRCLYEKNANLRSLYRCVYYDLIRDSVSNRSEASLVVFRRHVEKFTLERGDCYPLVCFWHCCWTSTWFTDQTLADELIDAHEPLRDVIKDRAPVFSLTILRQELNDDAVVRMLQVLLKYKMMVQYMKVLQILFDYRLKNRDVRGCTEIVRNCETLGLTLSQNQQGKFICLLIDGKPKEEESHIEPLSVKDFKFRF